MSNKEGYIPIPPIIECDIDDLPPTEVEFRLEPQEYTVGDGRMKEGDYSFLTFPGVGVCIPIVISDIEEKAMLASIHANRRWSPEKLNAVIKGYKGTKLRIEYAERISANPDYIGGSCKEREQLLSYLKNLPAEGFHVERTTVPTESYIDHIGYEKGKGFVRLKII